MRMRHIVARVALLAVLSCPAITHLEAASNSPVELVADTIAYDSVTGAMVATGNVQMKQDDTTMTSQQAQYNSNTKEGHLIGSAQVVKGTANLVADDIRSYENTHMVATGAPVLTKDDKVLTGETIDYYSDRQYALVVGSANLTMPDSQLTAQQIEGFMDEQRAVAVGTVHIVSTARNLDATSDQAVYYGNKGQQGKTVMTGNVRAVQDGNVLTGNTMTLYLDNKTIDVEGRSKLIIIPQ